MADIYDKLKSVCTSVKGDFSEDSEGASCVLGRSGPELTLTNHDEGVGLKMRMGSSTLNYDSVEDLKLTGEETSDGKLLKITPLSADGDEKATLTLEFRKGKHVFSSLETKGDGFVNRTTGKR